jgi:hypothetical protein
MQTDSVSEMALDQNIRQINYKNLEIGKLILFEAT